MKPVIAAVAFLVCASSIPLRADEGMWLYNQFPKDRVKQKYGFEVSDAFLDHLRLASVRMGASGSFVSPRGLIFTNHHVGLSCVQRVSSPEHNYVAGGFLAAREGDEIRCPGLEVSVLRGIEDVTPRVNAAVHAPAGSAEANRERKAVITSIEQGCTAASGGLKCEVVTLYAGARYHLYRYKRYTDVRLVMAPEFTAGFFGGDEDNFTYPRYCLDVTFMRAYEDGRPASTPEYLKWSAGGAREGELIFVSGHPAGSSRLATLAELRFRRDELYPFMLARLKSRIQAINNYGAGSAENERVGRAVLFSAENSQKRLIGFVAGLRDPRIMANKEAEERRLRTALENDPAMRREYGGVWEQAADALQRDKAIHQRYALLETGAATGADLFSHARSLVRMAAEKGKPNEQRLREYTETNLPAVERKLYSQAPITGSFETAVLAEYLDALRQGLGADDPVIKEVLAGRAPAEAARAYVSASRLNDVAMRRQLAGNPGAVGTSDDGMIVLARRLDGPARRIRKQYEDEVEAALTAAKTRIAQARFALHGPSEYPDSTATLRLAYGVVKGYRNKAGQSVPWATDFAGMYLRATGRDPFRLDQRWLDARARLDVAMPFNFAGTTDTHGGNSGSPTVNTKGEIVGILFDSNLEKLPNEFVYTDEDSRSVHVASQGIIEALRVVYRADRLVGELVGRQ